MTRAKISEYSATANDNTDVNGINIAEGCPPSSMNNMGREIMAALKRFQVGSDGDGVTVGGNLVVSGSTSVNTFNVDVISEKTSAAGVTIDGVLLKDTTVTANTVKASGTASSQGKVEFFEDTDNGTNFVALQAPAAITSDVTFTLPTADGTSGQVIQTNGSGALSFATVAASPGGSTTQVQYNNAGAFAGSSVLTIIDSAVNPQLIISGSNSAQLKLYASDNTADIRKSIVYNIGNTVQVATLNDAETSATSKITIDLSNGNFTIVGSTATKASGTTWANPSDQRLKKNVRDYGKGLVELQQVRVREWEYNGKGGTTEGTKNIGVVADEIISVLPDTVDTYEAKLNENDQETTDIKRFDATEITWLLVKAVQELSAKNDALEARIAALEAQ